MKGVEEKILDSVFLLLYLVFFLFFVAIYVLVTATIRSITMGG